MKLNKDLQEILDFIDRNGSISFRQYYETFHHINLKARINELRKFVSIKTEMIYTDTCHYAKYTREKEEIIYQEQGKQLVFA